MQCWRGTLSLAAPRSTPRHPSLAEIKTATTRNSSRLAGRRNRATGDNVTSPTQSDLPSTRKAIHNRTTKRGKPTGQSSTKTGHVIIVCIRVVPYETTVEASMNKSAKENFIDHAHRLLRNNLDVKWFTAVILKNRLLNRLVTVAFRLRSCRSHGLCATDRDIRRRLVDTPRHFLTLTTYVLVPCRPIGP